MTSPPKVAFLFDVDNTLIDNDRIMGDLKRHIEQQFGAQSRAHYFAIFEALYAELGYADYLGALQHYRLEDQCDTRLLLVSSFLVDYPFADRLYPGALSPDSHMPVWTMRPSPASSRRREPNLSTSPGTS